MRMPVAQGWLRGGGDGGEHAGDHEEELAGAVWLEQVLDGVLEGGVVVGGVGDVAAGEDDGEVRMCGAKLAGEVEAGHVAGHR